MLEQRTALVVEDDAGIGQLISTILNKRGYRTLQACTEKAAVACAESFPNKIDLVVCDVVLRFESGPTVAARVCALCPEAKVLFISGLPVDMLFEKKLMRAEDLADGKSFYLQKPFLPDDLSRFVEQILPAANNTPRLDLEGGTIENAFTAH
jgi:two-component system, cell cycle sensor histidine kinase and response regulator CckA